MNGFQKTTLTGYQTVQAHLSTMTETADMLPVAMSVDSDFFSRIHDVAFGEKGNKDREVAMREERIVAAQSQEDDQDMLREVVETALQDMKEQQAARMISMYGYDVSEDALNIALLHNLQNWDEISIDMSPELSQELHDLTVQALNTEGEEKQRILEEIDAKAPDLVQDTFINAKDIDNENYDSKLESSSKQDIESADDFLAEGSDSESFDMAFESPNSQITETFTLEVAGTGANAQSMMFSEEGFDITETEHSVAHQVPDDNTFVLNTLG